MVLLSLVSSAEQAGYFGASFRVIETLIAVPNLIVSGAFPIVARAARDDRARLSYAVGRLFDATVVLGGLVALMLLLGAPFIMDVVAGPAFAPSADVLRIQAAALLVTFAGAPLTYALLSLRRHRDLLLLSGAALAANATLVPLLADAHGARGAAAATLGAELVLTVGGALLLSRIDRSLRPSLAVVARAAPGFALGCALLAVPGLPSVVAMVLGAGVYAALALLLRAVPEELVIEARRVWRSRRRSSPRD
jgi:O-antigen/teichoic acid export membrane protein